MVASGLSGRVPDGRHAPSGRLRDAVGTDAGRLSGDMRRRR